MGMGVFSSSVRQRAFPGTGERVRARRKLRLLVALLTTLDVVLVALVVRPPVSSLAQRQEQLRRTQARQGEAAAKVQQLRELRAKLQRAIVNGREFPRQHFLSRPTAFSAMLADLQRVASQDGLRPSNASYTLEESDEQPGWGRARVNLTIEGDYPALVRFVNRLEQSPVFWIIQSLDVSGSLSRGLRLNLQTETYIVPS